MTVASPELTATEVIQTDDSETVMLTVATAELASPSSRAIRIHPSAAEADIRVNQWKPPLELRFNSPFVGLADQHRRQCVRRQVGINVTRQYSIPQTVCGTALVESNCRFVATGATFTR